MLRERVAPQSEVIRVVCWRTVHVVRSRTDVVLQAVVAPQANLVTWAVGESSVKLLTPPPHPY